MFGKRNTRLQARVSRNEPWERLVLTQWALGRVNAFPMILRSSRSPIRQNAPGYEARNLCSAGKTNIKCFQGSCRKCNFCPHHRLKKSLLLLSFTHLFDLTFKQSVQILFVCFFFLAVGVTQTTKSFYKAVHSVITKVLTANGYSEVNLSKLFSSFFV